MKSMKIASAAMLAMVGLGFAASPASAATGTTKEGTATVTFKQGDDFQLESVPSFAFLTTVTPGEYSINATNLTGKSIEVYRNYKLGMMSNSKNKVHVTISDLRYDTNKTVAVGKFSIGGKSLVGTGASKLLYTDKEITDGVTGKANYYNKAITSAGIGFSSTAVGVDDTLTATITYTAVAASTPN
ncbi:hypothetical protein [Enterococcus diestrammenae]|uniref:hypothetical protein n=1 Tax=Enterococcus diestrammenae TaxID=1155073 RepID=UPI0022E30519|nr:hypothetical protein [Enterococcus diestrammenae]